MEALNTTRYVRKPFEVVAVRVTAANMEDVAKWCGGEIRLREKSRTRYIYVEVDNARTERQKMAYVGDHVVSAGNGFKVYNDTSFHNSFDEIKKNEIPIVAGVTQLQIDLDVVQPELVMTKSGTTYQIDLANLFEGFEKNKAA